MCDIGLEREFLGIEESSVKELSEAKTFSVPWNVSGFRNVVEGSKELHPVVGVKGILGDGEIRIFVILKSGYAVGVSSVVGYEELSDKLEVPDDLRGFFKGVFKCDDGLVYVLREDAVKDLPKVEIDEKRNPTTTKEEKTETGREFLLLHVGDEKYAVKKEDISEITDSGRVNVMNMGNLYGFLRSSGKVVAVLSKWKVDPKWIVVLKDVALPCESFEVLNSELMEADGKEFVVYKGEQIDILSEEELRRWI